jgi:ABC-type multidrug transport system permease subunit
MRTSEKPHLRNRTIIWTGLVLCILGAVVLAYLLGFLDKVI